MLRKCVVTLLGVVVLAAGGCGAGSGKKDSGNSLTFWTAEDNPERVTATQAIVERFERQTNIKVNLAAAVWIASNVLGAARPALANRSLR